MSFSRDYQIVPCLIPFELTPYVCVECILTYFIVGRTVVRQRCTNEAASRFEEGLSKKTPSTIKY